MFKLPHKQFTKIACLAEDQIVNVEGIVCAVRENKEVTTSKGETIKLSVFDLKDESGNVRVSAWREHAEAFKDLKIGDKVGLKNVYVKKGLGVNWSYLPDLQRWLQLLKL